MPKVNCEWQYCIYNRTGCQKKEIKIGYEHYVDKNGMQRYAQKCLCYSETIPIKEVNHET